MKTNIYMIKALTNMHVGSGDVNFDIIDNKVQRDIITEYPTINASSLKGAIREHFRSRLSKQEVVDIFGGEKKNDEKKKNVSGTHRFFTANLLSYPVRSNKKPFFRAICPHIIEEFISYLDNFGLKYQSRNELEELKNLAEDNKVFVFKEEFNGAIIEDKKAEYKNFAGIGKLVELFGEDISLYSDEDFKDLIKELPVIARNKLENGESKNLWYEEVVPRESRFYFVTIDESKGDNQFDKILTSDTIQIGANASIGYGYTNIEKIKGIVGDSDE